MPNLQQLKMERLRAQTEREIIHNEILKGTLVRWLDVREVFEQKIAAARNRIMSIPSMFADKLTRSEVEIFRKEVNAALEDASRVNIDDIRTKDRRTARYIKAVAELNRSTNSRDSTKSQTRS